MDPWRALQDCGWQREQLPIDGSTLSGEGEEAAGYRGGIYSIPSALRLPDLSIKQQECVSYFIFNQLLAGCMAAATFKTPFFNRARLVRSATCITPPKRRPAVMVGLPRIPIYLKRKAIKNKTHQTPKEQHTPVP